MVIDTSAIMAILLGEPDGTDLLMKMKVDRRPLLSAATLVELQIVCIRRAGVEEWRHAEAFLQRAGVQIVPFDHRQAMLAKDAYLRFGKGRHAAGLNMGDCMTYALAQQTGEPLLCKGEDFSRTDLLLA